MIPPTNRDNNNNAYLASSRSFEQIVRQHQHLPQAQVLYLLSVVILFPSLKTLFLRPTAIISIMAFISAFIKVFETRAWPSVACWQPHPTVAGGHRASLFSGQALCWPGWVLGEQCACVCVCVQHWKHKALIPKPKTVHTP